MAARKCQANLEEVFGERKTSLLTGKDTARLNHFSAPRVLPRITELFCFLELLVSFGEFVQICVSYAA